MPRDGCRECSRRRIKCDQGTPECAKCLKKGIKCTGIGRQIRFVEGTISKGRRKGHTFANGQDFATKLSKHLEAGPLSRPHPETRREIQTEAMEHITVTDSPVETIGSLEDDIVDGDVEEIERSTQQRQDHSSTYTSLDDSTTISFHIDLGADLRLELLKPGIRMLFNHCKLMSLLRACLSGN